MKQSEAVKDNIEEVTHISRSAAYVISVFSSGLRGNIAATVAASRPKYLPEYVMLCTLLGILDFPRQECQLNRKRDQLRELSLHRRQGTMENKDGERRQPASRPGHNSSALSFKRTPVYLWCHFIARLLFQRGCIVVPSCLKVWPLKSQPEFYNEPPADLCACEFPHINIHARMCFTLSHHLMWAFF